MTKTATTASLNKSCLAAFRKLDFSKSALKVFSVLKSHLISDSLTSRAPPLFFSFLFLCGCLLKTQCQNANRYENSFLLDGPIPAFHRSLPIYIFEAAALSCLSHQILFWCKPSQGCILGYFLPSDVRQCFRPWLRPFAEMSEDIKTSLCIKTFLLPINTETSLTLVATRELCWITDRAQKLVCCDI